MTFWTNDRIQQVSDRLSGLQGQLQPVQGMYVHFGMNSLGYPSVTVSLAVPDPRGDVLVPVTRERQIRDTIRHAVADLEFEFWLYVLFVGRTDALRTNPGLAAVLLRG